MRPAWGVAIGPGVEALSDRAARDRHDPRFSRRPLCVVLLVRSKHRGAWDHLLVSCSGDHVCARRQTLVRSRTAAGHDEIRIPCGRSRLSAWTKQPERPDEFPPRPRPLRMIPERTACSRMGSKGGSRSHLKYAMLSRLRAPVMRDSV